MRLSVLCTHFLSDRTLIDHTRSRTVLSYCNLLSDCVLLCLLDEVDLSAIFVLF